jgi:ribonuclease HII
MPWVVGIDEAGYGPNLGPLVQAAVALHLPDADPAGWDTLRPVVRRAHEKADGRLLIDDSKKVYTRGGLDALERGVFAGAGLAIDWFREFIDGTLCTAQSAEIRDEHWYTGDERVPVSEWEWPGSGPISGRILANIVTPPRFNKVVDEFGSKGAVLSCGLVKLLQFVPEIDEAPPDEPLTFLCDKLGGRNYYAALVQQAFPDGWVVAERESMEESRYRVEGLGRPVTVTFRPRADGGSVAVALASMLCKYLREVCMRQFNRFWATHVPGIAPTAGYPGDAKRFYDAIRPAMEKLGLTEDQVWRKR